MGYRCSRCGEWHDEIPFAFHVPEPAAWLPEHEADGDSWLEEELCVEGEHFFIRGRIRIPVVGAEHDFEWGVWTSLSRDNFARTLEVWDRKGREAEPPMFGWLTVDLPAYGPSTLNLATMVHTQPLGLRPLVVLEPTDHPLSVEQREGITLARVQEIAEQNLHAA